VFPKKNHATDYAQNRACFRSGEIRILDATGNVERTIAFKESDTRVTYPCSSQSKPIISLPQVQHNKTGAR
jgi:hypothetical protein